MNPDYVWAILGACSIIVLFVMMYIGSRRARSESLHPIGTPNSDHASPEDAE